MAYVGNDPVNATDPSGEFGLLGAAVGAVIGTASAAYENYKETGDAFSDVGKIAKDAAVGGALGFLGGAGATFVQAGVRGVLTVGKIAIPVTGAATRATMVANGTILNTAAVMGSNSIEAQKNPEINQTQETVVESVLKTGGDVIGSAAGVPALGAILVGAKDLAENVVQKIQEERPVQIEEESN